MIKKEHRENLKHMLMMILACLLPLIIIFLLPFFGISNKWGAGLAIALMVFLHILMIKYHSPNKKEHKGVENGLLSH